MLLIYCKSSCMGCSGSDKDVNSVCIIKAGPTGVVWHKRVVSPSSNSTTTNFGFLESVVEDLSYSVNL